MNIEWGLLYSWWVQSDKVIYLGFTYMTMGDIMEDKLNKGHC